MMSEGGTEKRVEGASRFLARLCWSNDHLHLRESYTDFCAATTYVGETLAQIGDEQLRFELRDCRICSSTLMWRHRKA